LYRTNFESSKLRSTVIHAELLVHSKCLCTVIHQQAIHYSFWFYSMKAYPILILLFHSGKRCNVNGFLTLSIRRIVNGIGEMREKQLYHPLASSSSSVAMTLLQLEDTKSQLIQSCNLMNVNRNVHIESVRSNVQRLEDLSKTSGIGQCMNLNILSGEWYYNRTPILLLFQFTLSLSYTHSMFFASYILK